jgi:hypothetical protein
MLERLKKKWGITSNLQIILIMVVFSLAGMSIGFVRRPLFHVFGIEPTTPFWIKTLVYLASIFPIYQVLLLIYGTLLGQFRFFWEKEKKMVQWIGRKVFGWGLESGRT